jgi:hypothetical protein
MHFDVIDFSVIAKVVVDLEAKGLILARATSEPRVALFNDIEPVVLAIQQ